MEQQMAGQPMPQSGRAPAVIPQQAQNADSVDLYRQQLAAQSTQYAPATPPMPSTMPSGSSSRVTRDEDQAESPFGVYGAMGSRSGEQVPEMLNADRTSGMMPDSSMAGGRMVASIPSQNRPAGNPGPDVPGTSTPAMGGMGGMGGGMGGYGSSMGGMDGSGEIERNRVMGMGGRGGIAGTSDAPQYDPGNVQFRARAGDVVFSPANQTVLNAPMVMTAPMATKYTSLDIEIPQTGTVYIFTAPQAENRLSVSGISKVSSQRLWDLGSVTLLLAVCSAVGFLVVRVTNRPRKS